MTDAHRVSIDVDAADAAARPVLRLRAVGEIDIVWSMLHHDYRIELAADFLCTGYGGEMLDAYGSRLHRAQFHNLARRRLLDALGPLPWAEADRRVRTVALFPADDSVVVILDVDGEPDCRWDIEMTLTDGRWFWHNVATR